MKPLARIALFGVAVLVIAPWQKAAFADGPRVIAPDLPVWRTECGSCHVPYPPGLLPAREWKAVMARLEQHYGSDASLAPERVDAIAAYLVRYAGSERVASMANPPRISASVWFRREHREVASAAWSRPSIGSPANCAACHPGAEAGRFDERAVRIPR